MEEIKKSQLSEYFYKNKHLLGFTYPGKNLVIIIHELVTNSLDNCIINNIKPEISIDIKSIGKEGDEPYFLITVSDNGTGIAEKYLSTIFSQFLQGSKFNVNRETLGQQGIGASGVVMFSKITTGKQTELITSDGKNKYDVLIDMDITTGKSLNKIISKTPSNEKERGTTIKVYAKNVAYSTGQSSVDEYIKLIWLANPFAHITLKKPDGTKVEYKPIVNEMPAPPKILPYHPLGLSAHDLITIFNKEKE
ncbi:MAG: ATP-binding protein [Saccharolobus sp.]